MALAFATEYRDELRYVALWGRWLRYDGAKWRHDDTLNVFDLARDLCRDYSKKAASASTVAAVEKLCRADRRLAATTDQWDVDPYLLGTPAGVVDLRNGTVRPTEPFDYTTKT